MRTALQLCEPSEQLPILLFERANPFVLRSPLFLHKLEQSLNGGEGDPLPINEVDVPVVVTNAERGGEVLRHRADMAGTRGLFSVVPGLNGYPGKALEDRPWIDVREVLLRRSVAQAAAEEAYLSSYAALATARKAG